MKTKNCKVMHKMVNCTMHALQKFLMLQALTSLGQNALGSEITNGKKVKGKSMLYMASVQDNKQHICRGFLVSEYFVMTAADCVDRNPTSLSVVLGTHNLKDVDDDTMRYSVELCKHPCYAKVIHGNDIMLLKLPRKACLGRKGLIKPFKLPSSHVKLKENKTCSVAGWGPLVTGGGNVDELQVVEVPIINLDRCQTLWQNMLPANVICAGGYFTNKGICQGDSGGPLICNNKMAVSVVSFNNNNICDYPDVPNIYTDISKFLPWIKNILKKKKC